MTRRIKMGRISALVLLVTGALVGSGWSAAAEAWWSHQLEGAMLPTDQGTGWKHEGDGRSASEGNVLVVDSLERQACYWELNGGEGHAEWDGSSPTTVEFRMRVRTGDLKTAKGAEVVLSDGAKYYFVELDNPDYVTYRLVLENGSADFFEDGQFVRQIPGEPFSDGKQTNQLRFGDSSGGIEAISDWEFLRWTNRAALRPGQ